MNKLAVITTTVNFVLQAQYYVLMYNLTIRSGRSISWSTVVEGIGRGEQARRWELDVLPRTGSPLVPLAPRSFVLNVTGLNLVAIRITFNSFSKVRPLISFRVQVGSCIDY